MLQVCSSFDTQQTPLCAAVYFCYITHEIGHVERLLEHATTQVDFPDGYTLSTPLAYAAYYGMDLSAELLMSKGADPKKKDKNRMTPLRFAQKNKDERMLDLLRGK